ncbi:MAG: spherulation-specific family 4 protein [Thaumarchaeota archaeon]|nr:spherulation-specific family 4 protein [Nitrososphaerota archaeon]
MIHASRIHSCYIIALFALACIVGGYQPHNASAMTPPGLMVPLYSYPGTMWDELIQEKNSHNSVPIIAIINPANGPGVEDNNYVVGVHNLQNAGIIVLGYVDTGYGSRNTTVVESEIDSYKNWYGVNGIFFDAMSYVHGNETFYKQLNNYTKSIGLTYTVGNPGADTLPSYVGTVDNIVIHDKKDLPPMSLFDGWHENFTKTNFSFVAYDVNDINKTYITNATKFVQYMYITNLTLPNPFLDLPNYIDKLMGMLESAGQNGTVYIKVNTYSDDDKPLNGLWSTVKSATNSSSGFTPLIFSAVEGQNYTVDVTNFGNYTFDHWDDGTTKDTRTIVPTQNVTLTAYYEINQTMQNRPKLLSSVNQTSPLNQTALLQPVPKPYASSRDMMTTQAQNVGSVMVNLLYPDGDRADYTLLSFKIYQDTNQSVYRQIDSVSGNPFYIGDLPLNHRYKVEVFVNGMCADIDYVDLEKTNAQLKMSLPLPVGMRVDVLYNDGVTPIFNATVDVNSQDNKTWATSSTDTSGETLRFWLEPTNVNTHYDIGVKINQHISFSYSPVFLYPASATVKGFDQEIKVITPWPSAVHNAIDVKIYDTQSKLVSSKNGNLMVSVFDNNGNKIVESQVNSRGEAHFTDLKVGDYILRASNMQNDTTWGESQVTLDGKKTNFTIYEIQKTQNNQTNVAAINPKTSSTND